jgi:flagellar hook-associated protein 1 FlgK
VQVSRIEAADGSVGIFVGGGQRLVLGASADRLTVLPDPSDPSRVAVGVIEGPFRRTLDPDTLGGGAIAGLLRFQNDDLVQGRTLLGQLAAALGGAVNQQQALGLTLQPPLGSVAGAALFGIGAPQALAHASNAQPRAAVTLTVVDPSALQASEYDLHEDAASPGQWLVTRRADGMRFAISAGDVVDGFRIDFGVPAPASGDRFLLQPVSRVANGFTRLLDDPRDLAAAAPLLAAADPANTGTVAAASLALQAPPLPGARALISFTDDLGHYSWELRDAGNALLSSGSGQWQPGQTLPAQAVEINGFTLTLAGVPRSGDRLTVVPTPAGALASNNGNALALLALRDARLVGGLTVNEQYAQAIASIGVRVQGSRSAAEISSAVAAEAEQARSSESGVNLDEEAARLIQFQQSYQAAAKVLQVAQTLFESLLQAAAR